MKTTLVPDRHFAQLVLFYAEKIFQKNVRDQGRWQLLCKEYLLEYSSRRKEWRSKKTVSLGPRLIQG